MPANNPMTTPPPARISVVTPCFNSVKTIRDTIESVLTQNYPNFEHIVMDGGSTDGTLELLKEYPHLKWISAKDEGHYDAMNRGIEWAGGEIIPILNSDDCFRPGTFEKVARAFAEHPDWDGLFGDVVYVDGEGREIYRAFEAVFDFNVLRFTGVNYVIHQSLFVKKRIYDRLGGYRHKDFKNSCDYEFVLRLGRAGCTVGHLPEYILNYRYHNFGQSADLRIARNMLREAALIQQEYGCPQGWKGRVLRLLYRAKRQVQKLRARGKIDLATGDWKLRKHRREKAVFSSNIGLDKL